jgi:hypothetical protein
MGRWSMSEVTDFKDTMHKKGRLPSCWSGIRFTDGSQCQISVAHKVMIYKGKTMTGGKFYDADAHGLRVFLSDYLSFDDVVGLMDGKPAEHELLQPPMEGMRHPLLIFYSNLAIQHDSVEDFKEFLSQ